MKPDIEKMSARLADGTPLLFRPIRPEDKERLVKGFEALSPASRYTRFLRSITRLTDEQVMYLTEVDMQNHFAWVALKDDEPDQPGLAVARWIRLQDEPEVAEVAITVIDRYQHMGIGQTLLWLAALSAVRRNVRAFRVWMLGENQAAMNLMRMLGEMHGRWEQGVYVSTVPLPSEHELWAKPPVLPLIAHERSGGRGPKTLG